MMNKQVCQISLWTQARLLRNQQKNVRGYFLLHPVYLNQGVTLTFNLQYLISSVWVNEYSLSVLSKLFEAFMRYRVNNKWPDERIELADKQDNGTA